MPRHWNRLKLGFERLRLEMPDYYSLPYFDSEIRQLTKAKGNWRIRLSIWRSGGGLYTPEINLPEFLIEASPLPDSHFRLNQIGLKIGLFTGFKVPILSNTLSVLPSFKSASSLPYVLASIHKKESSLDDCLLLNTLDRLVCASSSNVFLVKNGELLTPSIPEGSIKGTMRGAVMDVAKQLGILVRAAPVPKNALAEADEIFLTNAIQGIRWVGEVEGLPNLYGNSLALELVEGLNGVIG